MKSIDPALLKRHAERGHDQSLLLEAMAAMSDPEDLLALLVDLCTPAELESIVDRWRVVLALDTGKTYRDIHSATGVSVTTIGRVARCHEHGEGGYQRALNRLAERGLLNADSHTLNKDKAP